MRTLLALAVALAVVVVVPVATAQTPADRERARLQNKLGWEDMTNEKWEKAAQSFQNAIDIDPAFEVPHYGLGRARMALKNYPGAIEAYVRCRDLYSAQAGKMFSNAQDAQRYRRDKLVEIDDQLRQVSTGPQSQGMMEMIRQLQNVRREIEESIRRGSDMSIESTVPAWVSLALGSAYFRTAKLADAERAYKAAIQADSRAGEAHSNLAVVYLETGRFAEAEDALKAAKKAGFKVNPQLEQAIKDKKNARP